MKLRDVIFTVFAPAVMLALPQAVQPAGMNEYDEMQWSPGVFQSDGSVTAVGLTSKAAGTIYWSYFDPNGNGLVSGSISVEQDRLTPFIWDSTMAGGSALINVPGILLFGLDTDGNGRIEPADGNNLGSNAFIVDLAASDVVYTPTIDIDAGAIAESDPTKWTNLPIQHLDSSDGKTADSGDTMDMQYMIDGAAGGDDTMVFVFTTKPVSSSQTMTIYDGAGTSKSITVPFLFNHLNAINPEQVPGVTSEFVTGFIRWTVPMSTSATAIDVFAGTTVESPTFGAIQTLLPNYDD